VTTIINILKLILIIILKLVNNYFLLVDCGYKLNSDVLSSA